MAKQKYAKMLKRDAMQERLIKEKKEKEVKKVLVKNTKQPKRKPLVRS